MVLRTTWLEQVHHPPTPRHHEVREKPPMTLPPELLGAEECRRHAERERFEPLDRGEEWSGRPGIGVVAKRRHLPRSVGGGFGRHDLAPASAEPFAEPLVLDTPR